MDNLSKDVKKRLSHKRSSSRQNLIILEHPRTNSMQRSTLAHTNSTPRHNHVDNLIVHQRAKTSWHGSTIAQKLMALHHRKSNPDTGYSHIIGQAPARVIRGASTARIMKNTPYTIIETYAHSIALSIDVPDNQVLPSLNIQCIEDDLDNIDGFVVANGRDIQITVKSSLDDETKNKGRAILEQRAKNAGFPFVSIWKIGVHHDND
jgi:hypothetical protein